MKKMKDTLRGHILHYFSYTIKAVPELPAYVTKGIKVIINKIKADQFVETMIVKTESEIKLSVEAWKDGKSIRTLSVQGAKEDKGIDSSAEAISVSLQENMQNLIQNLIPDIAKALEE